MVPGGADHLRRRLERAGTLPLKVSIKPVKTGENMSFMSEIGAVLSSFNTQINELDITADAALLAGTILSCVYSQKSTAYPGLRTLTVRVTDDDENSLYAWPRLDKILESTSFPMLEMLRIPSHFDCIPAPPAGDSSSFDNLHTLILDGSMEQESPSIALVANLLHSTPQLETLWFKTLTAEQPVTVMNETIPRSVKNPQPVPIPVLLPKLTRLAVTAPGAGSDLLHCIEAPGLHDLHLDGSRTPSYEEITGVELSWSRMDAAQVESSLKRLATRSPELRRLAITSTYLSHEAWRWLLLGGREGMPFPQLESLALHGLNPISGEVVCGFDDELLMEYARQPNVSLRRLSLRHCTFALGGPAILQLFERVDKSTSECRLEVDSSCRGITANHLDTLAKNGVTVVFHQEELNRGEWWSCSYDVDACDSYAYC